MRRLLRKRFLAKIRISVYVEGHGQNENAHYDTEIGAEGQLGKKTFILISIASIGRVCYREGVA